MNLSSEQDSMIFLLIGEIRKSGETKMVPFNALLKSSDDDTAVRLVLEALAEEGFEEADLHQIGNLEDAPDDEDFLPAYQAAVDGEVALLVYEGGYDRPNPAATN